MTVIGNYAFDMGTSGSSIEKIEFAGNAPSIGSDAFAYCSALSEVTLGSGLQSIGAYAFSDCLSLTGVTFANPNGWSCSFSVDAANGTPISADDLADPESAAGYLVLSYYDYNWSRAE
jgi:hypothetical protein